MTDRQKYLRRFMFAGKVATGVALYFASWSNMLTASLHVPILAASMVLSEAYQSPSFGMLGFLIDFLVFVCAIFFIADYFLRKSGIEQDLVDQQ